MTLHIEKLTRNYAAIFAIIVAIPSIIRIVEAAI